jgi:predicted amidohydrolase
MTHAPPRLRIAACQYPIERLPDFEAWAQKLTAWVDAAVAEQAELLVFPEYAWLELTSILDPGSQADLQQQLRGLQALLPAIETICSELARRAGIWLLGSSLPHHLDGGYVNRAWLYSPSGARASADKLQMTRFERETWGITGASSGSVFETTLGKIGVALCYDSEFPLLVRRLVECGAWLVLVPSCTDTLAGYHRVRVACQARALENQCYVVQAVTVGTAPWSIALDENRGAAGVFAPPDHGLPDDGVVALGQIDNPGWVYADLTAAAIETARRAGQVFGHRDWGNPAHVAGTVRQVQLA